MKYIFDFDDVLFNNTKQFKEHMYKCLEKVGVPRSVAESYYKEVRKKEFSLRVFISKLLKNHKTENVYEEIIKECNNFVNTELFEIVKKLGKSNCYIVSNGEKKFQEDKIERSGLVPLFSEIFIVPGSKKEIIEGICKRNKDEKVIFVDDKIKFFEDLDFKKCPNLKTILYDKQGLLKLKQGITR